MMPLKQRKNDFHDPFERGKGAFLANGHPLVLNQAIVGDKFDFADIHFVHFQSPVFGIRV